MDARIDRDTHLKQLRSQSRIPTQTWYEWFWGIKKAVPARAIDAGTSIPIRTAFIQMLDQVEPPNTFKPSEVAQQLSEKELASLGYETWEECLPGVYELAFEMRELGDCEILRKGANPKIGVVMEHTLSDNSSLIGTTTSHDDVGNTYSGSGAAIGWSDTDVLSLFEGLTVAPAENSASGMDSIAGVASVTEAKSNATRGRPMRFVEGKIF